MDLGLAVSRGNMPKKYPQTLRMDESAAVDREKLGERDQILMGRGSRRALVSRDARVQIQSPMGLNRPVLAQDQEGMEALVLGGAADGGLAVSRVPQTSARRHYCGCDPRQNRSGEQGRRE